MRIILSKEEQAMIADIANKYVKNGHVLVQDGELYVPDEEGAMFISAIAPYLKDTSKIDAMLSMPFVQSAICSMAGVSMKNLTEEDQKYFNFKEMISEFIVRSLKLKMQMKSSGKQEKVVYLQDVVGLRR